MKVTILVPIYNVEQYIAECARSLFEQTYTDIEYVFCDDCTPDRSIEVLREVMEQYPGRKGYVRIIRNDHNKGLGGTRAHLLEEISNNAEGICDAFAIVDSDDVLPKNAIEVLVKRMKETDADIVEGASADYAGGKQGAVTLTYHGDTKGYFKRILCQNILSNHVWAKLYNVCVLQEVQPLFFEGIDYTEDYCATARLCAVCSRAWTDEVVYLYRTDNVTSYTKTISEKSMQSYFRATREVLHFYRNRGHLPLQLEVGVQNCYREAEKNGMPYDEVDRVISYYPEHMRTHISYKVWRSGLPFAVRNIFYKIIRAWAIL